MVKKNGHRTYRLATEYVRAEQDDNQIKHLPSSSLHRGNDVTLDDP
jgi:hypothetical protein